MGYILGINTLLVACKPFMYKNLYNLIEISTFLCDFYSLVSKTNQRGLK